jgi:HlyD family secretion protein
LAIKHREIIVTILSGKRRWWIIVLLLVAVVGLIEFFSRAKPLAVIVQQVERGKVEAIVANTRAGTVKACRRAHLAPQGGGQIAMLQAHVGDRVEAGQVLLTLWNEDLKAQLRLAQAEQKAAAANAEQACLRAEEAQRDARRQKSLKDKGQISEEAYDRSVTGARAGEASCRAARAQVGVAESRVDVADAALERTLLKAPFPGYIAEVNGELGEYVTPSPPGIPTPPAIDLVDTSCLYISAPIDEVDAPKIRIGMLARITLDAVPDHYFLGAVDRIAPYVQEQEKQARTVEVEALFANPDEYKDLIPGYSADIEIIVAKRDDVLRIPTEAVMEGGQVLVFPPNTGVLEARKIETGLSNWQYTEVVSGLSADEQVVTSVGRPGVETGVMAIPETQATGQ